MGQDIEILYYVDGEVSEVKFGIFVEFSGTEENAFLMDVEDEVTGEIKRELVKLSDRDKLETPSGGVPWMVHIFD